MSSSIKPTEHRIVECLLAGALLAIAGCGRADSPGPQRLPRFQIRLGAKSLAVEVARTEEERRTGLMHRKRLAADEGMLFVFPEERVLEFYMKNTYVPLSIAFIGADREIKRIADMQPLSLETVSSGVPCLYALEMPRGWFERNGIHEGDRLAVPAGLLAQD